MATPKVLARSGPSEENGDGTSQQPSSPVTTKKPRIQPPPPVKKEEEEEEEEKEEEEEEEDKEEDDDPSVDPEDMCMYEDDCTDLKGMCPCEMNMLDRCVNHAEPGYCDTCIKDRKWCAKCDEYIYPGDFQNRVIPEGKWIEIVQEPRSDARGVPANNRHSIECWLCADCVEDIGKKEEKKDEEK